MQHFNATSGLCADGAIIAQEHRLSNDLALDSASVGVAATSAWLQVRPLASMAIGAMRGLALQSLFSVGAMQERENHATVQAIVQAATLGP